jgi:hypothetical protein
MKELILNKVRLDPRWSHMISLDEVDFICYPGFPEGALISVLFECTQCNRYLVANEVVIPSYEGGGTTFGNRVDVDCECGAEYVVQANSNMNGGWDVDIDRCDDTQTIRKKNPMTFQYRSECDWVCEERDEDVTPTEQEDQEKIDSFF